MGTIKTFGTVDERSLEQLKRCMAAGDAEFGVLCADHHPGYSQPIGGGIAYEGYVSPSGVGYDIGCGNKAARTELTRDDLDALGGVEAVMAEITRRISFGMGVPAAERTDHPVLERIRNADFAPQRKLAQLAESQLGTVGSGNHYVNVMEDEDGRIWVGVHFGSRGFGHTVASTRSCGRSHAGSRSAWVCRRRSASITRCSIASATPSSLRSARWPSSRSRSSARSARATTT